MPRHTDSDPVDIPRRLGAAAVGGRLRRLSERIDEGCARIYAEHGIDFEQRWLTVVYVLALEGPQPVGKLAAMIGISHASVSESRKSLQKAGLILAETDKKDARTIHLRLSAKGKKLFERLRPVMETLMRVSVNVNEEAGRPLEAIERMEAALARQSIYDRFQALAATLEKSGPS
jgi:MarR family transcriptional regulator, organic hydroperoxide resistance regulator